MDSDERGSDGDPAYCDQRGQGEQGDAASAGIQRDSLPGETFSGSETDFDGGENLRETMSDDLKIKILVVDDEQSIRKLCMTIGGSLGFLCQEAESAESAATRLETDPPDLVLEDLKLPNLTGVELPERVQGPLPRAEEGLLTGHGSIPSALESVELGAYDYIEKPFRVEKM